MKKCILTSLLILLASPVIFTLIMFGVYSLPTDGMLANAAESVDIYQENRINYWTGFANSYFSNMEP